MIEVLGSVQGGLLALMITVLVAALVAVGTFVFTRLIGLLDSTAARVGDLQYNQSRIIQQVLNLEREVFDDH